VRPAYVGSVLLVALLAAGLAAVARLAPDRHVGLLGWIPLGMGLYQLARLAIRRESVAGTARGGDAALRKTFGLRRGRVAVAGVTLAASGDSLAAYAALFADTATLLVPWSVLGIGLGATAWSVLAVRLSGRPAVRSAVDRTGPVLLPLVLIGIGLYILGDTPTDVLSPP
jgi:cadmium resistance protein CadD (predicted permease)